jgi:hypothetical protein
VHVLAINIRIPLRGKPSKNIKVTATRKVSSRLWQEIDYKESETKTTWKFLRYTEFPKGVTGGTFPAN